MSSQKFKDFEKAFDQRFVEDGDGIWEFIDMSDYNSYGTELPFGGKLIEDLDQVNHDSYGNEDSILERVFYFEEFDIYIMFYGTRSSYVGEEWDGYKEVRKTTKTVTTWG